MVALIQGEDSLHKLFAGITEHCFQSELGVADPPLIGYVTDLLVRFTRTEAVYKVRNVRGRPLREVADLFAEAQTREAGPRREVFRHIGDFILFWTGVYPESLAPGQSRETSDVLFDFSQQGKRAYSIAGTFDAAPYAEEAPVLQRLSREFELCSLGLSYVRKEWEAECNSRPSD